MATDDSKSFQVGELTRSDFLQQLKVCLQSAVPRNGPAKQSDSEEDIESRFQKVYHSFKATEDAKGRELTFKEAYGWIKENGPEEYDLSSFDTWKRSVGILWDAEKYPPSREKGWQHSQPKRNLILTPCQRHEDVQFFKVIEKRSPCHEVFFLWHVRWSGYRYRHSGHTQSCLF